MEIQYLLQVYNSYIKYIYYLLALIIVIVLIILLRKTVELVKSLQVVSEHGQNISDNLNSMQEKIEVIDHTLTS